VTVPLGLGEAIETSEVSYGFAAGNL
jgi:hypothetical protein